MQCILLSTLYTMPIEVGVLHRTLRYFSRNVLLDLILIAFLILKRYEVSYLAL